MKLLLSSNGSTAIKNFHLLSRKNKDNIKIAWIVTATKRASNINYVNSSLKEFFNQQYKPTLYDIQGKTYNNFEHDLKNYDILFVEGGQPCFLLKLVKETGFDKFIKTWIKTKPYASASAGSYIMCPTIEMAFWHKPDRETFGLKNISAIGVIDFLVTAHYTEEKGIAIQDSIKNSKYKTQVLTDGQALFVQNNKTTLIEESVQIRM